MGCGWEECQLWSQGGERFNGIYTVKYYYSAIKRNEIGSFVEMWMDLEAVIRSEVSQKEKNTYMWNLEKWYSWSYLQSTSGDTNVEIKHMDTKKECGVGWIRRLRLTCTHYWYFVWNRQLKRTYYIAQGTLLSALWWAKWEGNPKKGGMYTYSWFILLFSMHWRRKRQPTPVFLPGESQGRRGLVGCRLWGHTESDTTEAT